MARCPSCNKFASFEGDEEPEFDDSEIDSDGSFSLSVRIVKRTECCSEEVKENTFDLHGQVDEDWFSEHVTEKDVDPSELEVETSCEQTSEGGGRYAKSYYGVNCVVTVNAPDGESTEIVLEDKIQASHMDEIA